jgi:hypothetical protein
MKNIKNVKIYIRLYTLFFPSTRVGINSRVRINYIMVDFFIIEYKQEVTSCYQTIPLYTIYIILHSIVFKHTLFKTSHPSISNAHHAISKNTIAP